MAYHSLFWVVRQVSETHSIPFRYSGTIELSLDIRKIRNPQKNNQTDRNKPNF